MKELFCGFLNVSISGSLVICAILLLRFLFRRGSKSLNCVFWLISFVRLLMPFQIPAPWSLLPPMPSVASNETQLLGTGDTVLSGSLPSFVPQATVINSRDVVVDYVAILAIVWTVGMLAMLLYMVISYIGLHRKVRDAVKIEKNIYRMEGLRSAFLLGYFAPKIYLPADLDPRSSDLVITHELMHKKRGDNWLLLFNPLVWLAYILLCRDVESACDEKIVGKLGSEEKKAYCTALLACGKTTQKTACPVAFGECSIRQRIKNVLSGKKPALWISVIAVVAVLFVSFFLMTDPIKPVVVPQYYAELESLIGKDQDTVCDVLNITKEQLGEDLVSGVCQTTITAEYMGEPFALVLYFRRDNGLLSGFRYYATYEGVTEDAAEVAASVARQLWKNYGKGFQWELKDDPKLLKDITGEQMLAIHRKVFERTGDYKVMDMWNLTNGAPDNVKTFLNQVEISELWQNMYGEKARLYEVSPRYYLSFTSGVDKETETTYIILEYRTGWIPGHYSAMVTGN